MATELVVKLGGRNEGEDEEAEEGQTDFMAEVGIKGLQRSEGRRRKTKDRKKVGIWGSDKPPFLCGNRALNV